jgi:signal transduction histidine kinase
MSTEKISLLGGNNLLKKSVISRKMQQSKDLASLPCQGFGKDNCSFVQKSLKINDIFVYPLIISERLIGTIAVGIGQNSDFNFEQQKELLDSLPDIVSIALDNSLLYETIEKANSRLKELDELKDEFVSVASHELRTPMTAIKSYLWMALSGQGGPLNDKQKLYLQRSYDSTDRLIRLVNDMLNISRIESGRISLELDKVDLPKLVNEVIAEVSPRAKELEINIKINSDGPIPEVIADADKIREVIINLVGNSLKFTPKHGVISIDYYVRDNQMVTQISDTGTGFSPEMKKNLFQKFSLIKGSYQTNQTSAVQSTGLGLYICKQILSLHKGEIWADSKGINRGSTFSFSLPVLTPKLLKEFQKQFQHSSNVGIIHSKI